MKLTRRNLIKTLFALPVAASLPRPPAVPTPDPEFHHPIDAHVVPGPEWTPGDKDYVPWICSGWIGPSRAPVVRHRDARGRFITAPRLQVL